MRLPVLLLGLTLAATGTAAAQSAEEKAGEWKIVHKTFYAEPKK